MAIPSSTLQRLAEIMTQNEFTQVGDVKYHHDLIQGCDEWFEARCGVLTASEMNLILTPTLKVSANAKTCAHLYGLLSQRITGRVDPGYIGYDMMRGYDDEITARDDYSRDHAQVVECGFITTDRLGFVQGYSPDGLVGDFGLFETKSRAPKFQVELFIADEVPVEHMLQLQTGLQVTGRKWIDYNSFCGGLPTFTKRVFPIPEYQEAITKAATEFEASLAFAMLKYQEKTAGLTPTERKTYEGIMT